MTRHRSVCIHRPETPGFFTGCGTCACGQEVRAEDQTDESEAT